MNKAKPQLLEHSRNLRRHQTDAEALLWNHLRGDRFRPIRFRRQKIIGPYIVDFICSSAKLVIELDGSQHSEHLSVKYDKARTSFLMARGYRVLRFWNNDVFSNTESILIEIWREVFESPPSPQPSPASGRGSCSAIS